VRLAPVIGSVFRWTCESARHLLIEFGMRRLQAENSNAWSDSPQTNLPES
jgi:hypothetical protein